MMILQRCRLAAMPALCLEKARALLLALRSTGPDLVLMLGLEVLLWIA